MKARSVVKRASIAMLAFVLTFACVAELAPAYAAADGEDEYAYKTVLLSDAGLEAEKEKAKAESLEKEGVIDLDAADDGDEVMSASKPVLLIAPPPFSFGEDVQDEALIKESEELARLYKEFR